MRKARLQREKPEALNPNFRCQQPAAHSLNMIEGAYIRHSTEPIIVNILSCGQLCFHYSAMDDKINQGVMC